MSGTVLVTGGSGFIAGWVIIELLKQGYSVRATLRNAKREAAVRSGVASHVAADDRLSFVYVALTRDEGWDAAMVGCDQVLHIASPLGREGPADRDALIGPARDGTLRVLKAAVAAGVERVVMTSAAATARERGSAAISTEAVWADPDDPLLDGYRLSKILAERAAWAFMQSHGGSTSLTTIHPGAVFGPILPGVDPASVWVVAGLLNGRPPRLLNLGFSIVDVRDLAAVHVAALTATGAPGERFLATGHFLWMPQIARILRQGLGSGGAKVPTRTLPDPLVQFLALFMPRLRIFRHDLGQRREADNSKARERLGFTSRPPEQTLLDCARSLNLHPG